jgi:hypothetical protein
VIANFRPSALTFTMILVLAMGIGRDAFPESSSSGSNSDSGSSSGSGSGSSTAALDSAISNLTSQVQKAQSPSSDNSSTDPNSQNGGQSANSATPPPTLTPSQPAKSSDDSDRSGKNGAAQAAAAAGAAMAMMSCVMMMNEARKQNDPSMKSMMMMMGMQQCAQGAQDMANANQNGDGKNQLTADSTPKQAQLNTSPQKSPQASKDDPISLPATTAQDDSSPEVPVGTPTSPKMASRPKDPTPPEEKHPEKPVDSFTQLSPIAPPKLSFDDNSKGDGTTPMPGNNGGFPAFFGASSNATPEQLKKAADEAAAKAAAEGSGKRLTKSDDGTAGGAAGASGGGEESGKGPGADPFEGMLGQLFGPKDGGEPLFLNGGGGAGDVVSLPPTDQGTGKRGPNIFEYASYRYRVASYTEGKVRTRPLQARPPTGVKTAAVAP